jgi:flagellar basal-body rod protein FlgG
MIPQIKKQETIANNLANASSPGFKKDSVFTEELSRAEMRRAGRQADWQTPMIDQVYTSFEQGGMDKTGNSLDVALEGTGFFVFETPDGEQVLSRAGRLMADNAGYIVNAEGHRLMGDGGPINAAGGEVAIAENGRVEVNNSAVGTIRVVDVPEANQLIKIGNTEFALPQGIELRQAVRFAIRQGYLESSNVEVVTEMIDMITSFRNFEADANAIKAQDESLEKLFNNVGRVR